MNFGGVENICCLLTQTFLKRIIQYRFDTRPQSAMASPSKASELVVERLNKFH